MAWIVTREGEDGLRACALLRERGWDAVHLPCLETTWHPWPWSDAGALTLFTSRRTVAAWVRAGKPALGSAAALLPATAEALAREGVAAEVRASGGARNLAERAAAWWHFSGGANGAIRYPTSGAGMASAEQAQALAQLERVAPVERRVVYDVQPPARLAERATARARGAWCVTLWSPSAVEAFLPAVAGAPPPCVGWCIGGSTARAWEQVRPPGWPAAQTFNSFEAALETLP